MLHSATRLTHGVPWLCGPASRRVCYFVGSGRRAIPTDLVQPYGGATADPMTRSFAANGLVSTVCRRDGPKVRDSPVSFALAHRRDGGDNCQQDWSESAEP